MDDAGDSIFGENHGIIGSDCSPRSVSRLRYFISFPPAQCVYQFSVRCSLSDLLHSYGCRLFRTSSKLDGGKKDVIKDIFGSSEQINDSVHAADNLFGSYQPSSLETPSSRKLSSNPSHIQHLMADLSSPEGFTEKKTAYAYVSPRVSTNKFPWENDEIWSSKTSSQKPLEDILRLSHLYLR